MCFIFDKINSSEKAIPTHSAAIGSYIVCPIYQITSKIWSSLDVMEYK